MNPSLVRVRELVVRYGATTALTGVSLDFLPGEVHALVGENGAGKSTLLQVLAGVRRPDAGTVAVSEGARVAWVPQETELPADLSVEAAIFLGAELCGPGGWLRRRAMREAARALLARVGATMDPADPIRELLAPQRKQVQIAHALRDDPDLLLLDEPTAVLGTRETECLFAILAQRRSRGRATVYVSHRLGEVMQVADRVTVLRDGTRISTDSRVDVSVADLVGRMVGRAVTSSRRPHGAPGATVVRLTDVSAGLARGISLAVHAGEIVGLAGLVGAGRSDVLEAIVGIHPIGRGTIVRTDEPVLLPEDRARNGTVPTLSVRENLFLPCDTVWIDRQRERRGAADWVARLRIRTEGTEAPVTSLSGGNQQKLLLARALRHAPRLLLLDEPTAGVDVGAKAEIHAEIAKLADAGVAVLIASSELSELLQLCDRILAMYGGRIVGELAASEATEERLAALITGSPRVSGVGGPVLGAEST